MSFWLCICIIYNYICNHHIYVHNLFDHHFYMIHLFHHTSKLLFIISSLIHTVHPAIRTISANATSLPNIAVLVDILPIRWLGNSLRSSNWLPIESRICVGKVTNMPFISNREYVLGIWIPQTLRLSLPPFTTG